MTGAVEMERRTDLRCTSQAKVMNAVMYGMRTVRGKGKLGMMFLFSAEQLV